LNVRDIPFPFISRKNILEYRQTHWKNQANFSVHTPQAIGRWTPAHVITDDRCPGLLNVSRFIDSTTTGMRSLPLQIREDQHWLKYYVMKRAKNKVRQDDDDTPIDDPCQSLHTRYFPMNSSSANLILRALAPR